MEVIFEIEYHTSWGSRLVWCGDGRRVAMEYGRDGVWWCSMGLESGAVEYRYEVETVADGRVTDTEWRSHRLSVPRSGPVRMTVRDGWNERDDRTPFYASAFTQTIFAREERTAPVAVPHDGGLALAIEEPTVRPDEVLAVAGSAPELGGWGRFVTMDDSDFPRWRVIVKSTTPFEYKFVLLDRRTRRPVAWEEGPNRRCDRMPVAGELLVLANLGPGRFPMREWRGAGTAVPVFSLRTASDFGVGEFPDLKLLVDWAASTGQRVVQLLPVNDTIRTGSFTDSYPYSAVSSFALHPLYLSLTTAGLRAGVRYRRQQERLNALPTVDYEEVMRLKLDWARRLFSERWNEVKASAGYAAFREENRSWLEPYAAFSALRDRHATADFRQWGDAARYDESVVEATRRNDGENFDFYCFLQYELHLQLSDACAYARQRGVALKGDIPIGVSPLSADVWQHPDLFHLDGQAGAPPDAFAEMGQNWGFPTYNWEAMARDGYAWWRERLRKMAEYFEAYRIDHILGFFRIWEIPTDAVHGLLGRFRPAMPFTWDELAAAGFRMEDPRYTRPQTWDWILDEIFGDAAGEVLERYVVDGALRPEVATQRDVVRMFGTATDERQLRIRDGLLRLHDDVLFIEDAERPGTFHPRIGGHSTFAYRALPQELRWAYDRLHDDFFYRRHDAFWRDSALRKLPALLGATGMLACGEDLGMIPACVPAVMEQLRILTLEIERMPKDIGIEFGDPSCYPYRSVGTTSTHDMAPVRSWWREDRGVTQRYFNEVLHEAGEAPADCTPALGRRILERTLGGRSMLVVLPLQDWLATHARLRRADPDEERINVPANPNHYWRYRLHLSLEELCAANGFNRSVKQMIRDAGRNM